MGNTCILASWSKMTFTASYRTVQYNNRNVPARERGFEACLSQLLRTNNGGNGPETT